MKKTYVTSFSGGIGIIERLRNMPDCEYKSELTFRRNKRKVYIKGTNQFVIID